MYDKYSDQKIRQKTKALDELVQATKNKRNKGYAIDVNDFWSIYELNDRMQTKIFQRKTRDLILMIS